MSPLPARVAPRMPRVAAALLQWAGPRGVRRAMQRAKGREAAAALIDAAAQDALRRILSVIPALHDSVPAAWQARLLRSLMRRPNDAALALLTIEGDVAQALWDDAEGRRVMTNLIAAAADAVPWMAANALRTIIDMVPAEQWEPLARTARSQPQ